MSSDNHPLSQPSYYFTDDSPHHNTLVPTVTGSNSGKRIVRCRKELWVEDSPDPFYQQVTIRTLPDDVLLEIFHFYVDKLNGGDKYRDRWDRWFTLVHVCQRWRIVVFASPRRLDLHLLCNYRRPVRETSKIWPELPIILQDGGIPTLEDADNVVAALKLTDRVTQIHLWEVPNSALERFAAAMQVPFPALRILNIWGNDRGGVAPVISDGFLGGSAPHLLALSLGSIPFPALRKLLLSATNLCALYLFHIPHSGYISPEEMVTYLSMLTRLERFSLEFRSPRSRPSQANRPPRSSMRAVLPSLTHLYFKGVTEYLEDLVARIDVPLLENIDITVFNQLIFDIFQLPKFLNRTPQFAVFDQVDVVLWAHCISVTFSSSSLSGRVDPAELKLTVSCRKLEWQLSSLPQVCGSTFSTLPHLERLDVREDQLSPPRWQDDMENSQWLELLQPFTTVKDLHISKEVTSRLALALQELSNEQATEVLPALQNLYIGGLQPSGPVQELEGIGRFVAARQLSGQPVAVHHFE